MTISSIIKQLKNTKTQILSVKPLINPNNNNVYIYSSMDERETRGERRRRTTNHLLKSSSMPLSRMFNYSFNNSLLFAHFQASHTLPLPFTLQESLLTPSLHFLSKLLFFANFSIMRCFFGYPHGFYLKIGPNPFKIRSFFEYPHEFLLKRLEIGLNPCKIRSLFGCPDWYLSKRLQLGPNPCGISSLSEYPDGDLSKRLEIGQNYSGISSLVGYPDGDLSKRLQLLVPNYSTSRSFSVFSRKGSQMGSSPSSISCFMGYSNVYSRKPMPILVHKRFSVRGFCEGTNENSDSESDNERESEQVKADPKEVERVCKVIEELFALDRNMEAVLDECGVNLTHELVIDVLERFRHARKPAFRFFCWAGQRHEYAHNSNTYNKMMFILGKSRQFETMVVLLEEIGEKGLLTIETFEIAIKTFAEAKERRKAVGIFELMKKYKFKVGVNTINVLLDNLGRAKLGKEAQVLFERLKERFTPNLHTYTVLLNGWCRVKNLLEAGRVWNEMTDMGFKPDIVAHNTMIDGLLKCKMKSDAIKMFEVMKSKGPRPNIRTYTMFIRDFCKQMKMREAVEYLEEMLKSGFEPDAAVYTCLMTGFGNKKEMDKVYALLKEMKDRGCPPDSQTYNALIKLLTNRKMSDDAVRIYKKMVKNGCEPTIHTYNMMMKSYFETRNFEMGRAVWEEMNRKGCCPDDNSYIVFIGGLIKEGKSEEACKYLVEMIEKGMKAPQLDYNKFVADFSRVGKPDIMHELAQKMKFSGKFEVSNVFARWGEMMKNRVKKRDPVY